jgi:hypothetical protein
MRIEDGKDTRRDWTVFFDCFPVRTVTIYGSSPPTNDAQEDLMHKLLFAGIRIACCSGPHLGRAAATPPITAPNTAVSANPAIQKVYWYY